MVTDVGTRRQIVDRSSDLAHGTCPVCLRRKPLLVSGRIAAHAAIGVKRSWPHCKGGEMWPTTEPSINGIVGGLGTFDHQRAELRSMSRVFGGAGVVDNDPEARSDAAQRRYEAGAGVRYSR